VSSDRYDSTDLACFDDNTFNLVRSMYRSALSWLRSSLANFFCMDCFILFHFQGQKTMSMDFFLYMQLYYLTEYD